jgi:chromosome partitioning protein
MYTYHYDPQGNSLMPVIVFASSKGGAGKTTACVVLASELARQGTDKNIDIALIDADPNQHTAAWAGLVGKPENISLYDKVTEDTILDKIEEAKNKSPFVLVDLEGVSSNSVTYAISQADLVIIPCQPSQNDAKEAVKTIKAIKNSSRMIGKEIYFSVLFTRISAAIITKTSKHLSEEFNYAGIDLFNVSLIDREVFRSIFSFGGTVNSVEAKNKKTIASRSKAEDNVKLFTEEVKQRLKIIMHKSKLMTEVEPNAQ